MRSDFPLLFLITLLLPASRALAQRALIKNGTPGATVDALKRYLLPEGFTYASGNDKEAVLTLDRGMVPQPNMYNGKTHTNLFHVFIEFHARFKQTTEGLEVSAYEDVVGSDKPGGSEAFRRRVSTRIEVDNMQHLLDRIQADLEARPTPPDFLSQPYFQQPSAEM